MAEGKDINYEGASGEVDFDENGDVRSGYALWEVRPDGDGFAYRIRRYVDPRDL